MGKGRIFRQLKTEGLCHDREIGMREGERLRVYIVPKELSAQVSEPTSDINSFANTRGGERTLGIAAKDGVAIQPFGH